MADEKVDIDEASLRDIYRAISSDEQVIAAKLALANQAAEYAKSIAPVETGTYRDSIHVRQGGTTVWVGFEDPKSHLVEYGSVDTPEFAVRAKTEEKFNGGR